MRNTNFYRKSISLSLSPQLALSVEFLFEILCVGAHPNLHCL
ncbi:hypothetical protein B8A07_10675 [Staphylococcus aureus]|nr:hypothetical protein B8A07_10675 [Staphylococcus aureus]